MTGCPICGQLFETGLSLLFHRLSVHLHPVAKLGLGLFLIGVLASDSGRSDT